MTNELWIGRRNRSLPALRRRLRDRARARRHAAWPRTRPSGVSRSAARQAIEIANPPVTVSLGQLRPGRWVAPSARSSCRRGCSTSASSRFAPASRRAGNPGAEFVSAGIAVSADRPWERFGSRAERAALDRMADSLLRPGSTASPRSTRSFASTASRTPPAGRRRRVLRDRASPGLPWSAEPARSPPPREKELVSDRLCYFDDDLTMLTGTPRSWSDGARGHRRRSPVL